MMTVRWETRDGAERWSHTHLLQGELDLARESAEAMETRCEVTLPMGASLRTYRGGQAVAHPCPECWATLKEAAA